TSIHPLSLHDALPIFIDGGTSSLVSMLRRLVAVPALVTLVFVALLAVTYWMYARVPRGFVPDEDQGYLFILVQTPQGASLSYTRSDEHTSQLQSRRDI